jgi:cytochrome P450
MDQLERDGPDGSTMSAMYFARDEEDPSKRLSRDEVVSNALLLILAGSETAASTLTVTALAMGLHKDVLKKLKDEQLAMIAKRGTEEMTREMIEKDCPYLDAVIKETMRIKPLGTTGAMRVAEETIVVDGKQIPKGNAVVFNIYLTHEGDPAVKEDNNAHMDIVKGFKPERWLNDSTKPTEYMPFGFGPRYCLGANLAMAEMKVFLALLARRVDFNLVNMSPDNVTWKKASIIPKPADGAVVALASLS